MPETEGKGEAAIQRLRAEDPAGTVSLQHLDLGDLDLVRDAARHIVGAHDRLDRLILNAGVMIPPLGRTAQGFEEQFGVNHLGHFALTCLLHPLLSPDPWIEVTAVTSVAGDMGRMWWEDLNWGLTEIPGTGLWPEQARQPALHPRPRSSCAI